MCTKSIKTEVEQDGVRYWQCNNCGYITYTEPVNKNTTCSQCHRGRFRVMVKCKCGRTFHPENKNAKFCSKECLYKYRDSSKKKGKHYPHLQRAEIRVCELCGKTFRAVNDYKGKTQKYCSKECWSKRSTKINYCRYCGAEIKTNNSVNKQYCSNDCRNNDYKIRFKGENSHFWEGGKTEQKRLLRSSSAYREWRKKVFERDNYTCQECGQTECTLEAHHIKEVCNYPELIFDVNNGKTLCHDCHEKTDNYCNKAKKRRCY